MDDIPYVIQIPQDYQVSYFHKRGLEKTLQ
jgi:hypothetical protein